MRYPRYAIIPSNGRECLKRSFDAILPQVDWVILIKTVAGIGGWEQYVTPKSSVLTILDGDINISRWWNWGLDRVVISLDEDHERRPTKWDVAIINDDVIVPEGWFDAVSERMRTMQVAAACSGGTGGMPVLNTQAMAVPLHTRMQGFAFIVAGELGVRADERLKWYFTDDHVDWKSRELGGVVMIPGMHVEHLYPNGQLTPELLAQTAADAQTFVDIWGRRPW